MNARKITASIRIALQALRINKMRSALTMLGIVIGVAAVIAMVAVGAGAEGRIREQIASIGSNLIVVLSGSVTSSGIRMGTGNAQTLTEDDARAVIRECDAAAVAAPAVRGGVQTVFGNSNWGTQVLGTTPDYLGVRDIAIDQGQPFTGSDVEGAATVALLGKTVIDNLFEGRNPVGQIVRIKKVPFTVIGTLVAKGQSPTGQDQDDVILMPISTAKKKVIGTSQANYAAVGSIMVQAREGRTAEVQDQMRSLLRQRHHLQSNEDDDFTIRNMEEVFKAQETSARVMSILLAAIASVSLLVGGIGIMNIMLVSVSERTREIGLRQAVGARTRDILSQFLVEAVTLSIVGGVIGIAAGISASVLISHFAQWSTEVSAGSILVAFLFSALVGIFFGFYPARKAAYMDPIEALHYE
ncbi:MAG TPA: ABC transporter permease [Bryobacteraceae bacterium]|jgi:putative ABC transport system permease protein|nr:ABC transporter permease [Bryobacteraceae bacterium]